MKVLLDTNVLLRHLHPPHPSHPVASAAVRGLIAAGHDLYLVPQIFYESWVVATRPEVNSGFGLTTAVAARMLGDIDPNLVVLPDPPTLLGDWLALVAAHDCKGKVAHDARLAAALVAHGLTHLLTFNGKDFARFPGVTVLDPAAVPAALTSA